MEVRVGMAIKGSLDSIQSCNDHFEFMEDVDIDRGVPADGIFVELINILVQRPRVIKTTLN